ILNTIMIAVFFCSSFVALFFLIPRPPPKSPLFPYTTLFRSINDVTARGLQKRHIQWFVGKAVDTYCPMGPWIVTADAIGDVTRLDRKSTRLNSSHVKISYAVFCLKKKRDQTSARHVPSVAID